MFWKDLLFTVLKEKDKHGNHIPFIPNISLSVCFIMFLGIKNCWTGSKMIQGHTTQVILSINSSSLCHKQKTSQYGQAYRVIYLFFFSPFFILKERALLTCSSYFWNSCFLGLLCNCHSRASIHHYFEIFLTVTVFYVGVHVSWISHCLLSLASSF